jgi:hypothetical protein
MNAEKSTVGRDGAMVPGTGHRTLATLRSERSPDLVEALGTSEDELTNVFFKSGARSRLWHSGVHMAEDVEETAVAVDTEDGVAETPPERVDAAEPPIDDAAAPEGEEGDGTSDGKDDDDDDEGPPPLDAAEAVPMMTQGESQGTLACSVCLEPVAISVPTRCARSRAATASATAASTPGSSGRSGATAGGARSATRRPSPRTYASSSSPTFDPSWTPRSSTRRGRRSRRNAPGRIEAEANQLRISQRLKKLEERLKESEQERDDAIERARSGGGASGSGSGGASGAERRTQDGDAAAWGFLQPSVGGDKKRKKESEEQAERRAEGTILRAFDPNRDETIERERAEAEATRRRVAEEDERRHRESMRGRYVVRFTAPTRGAR